MKKQAGSITIGHRAIIRDEAGDLQNGAQITIAFLDATFNEVAIAILKPEDFALALTGVNGQKCVLYLPSQQTT